MRLINLDTGKAVRLTVKPAFRTRSENDFCFALAPGRYAIHSYEYSESKWYGLEMHLEPIRKAVPASAGVSATRYVFEIKPEQVQYVGTWDFQREARPVFSNEKARLDQQLEKEYRHLNFTQASLTIPQ